MKICLIVMIIINIILIIIAYREYVKINLLNKQLIKTKKNKIQASNALVRSVERAMIKAIDSGDIQQYKIYHNLYNNLTPEKRSL